MALLENDRRNIENELQYSSSRGNTEDAAASRLPLASSLVSCKCNASFSLLRNWLPSESATSQKCEKGMDLTKLNRFIE